MVRENYEGYERREKYGLDIRKGRKECYGYNAIKRRYVMNSVNQKIIDAVIEKAEKVCPGSLALIGIYGSVATGDEYIKSDLDLLILIQNDEGWQLCTGFILDDSEIGYDIYCTNWDGLKFDAQCHHAQISKLMDSQIVYIKSQEAYEELCKLREQTKLFLESEERFQRVNELMDKAKVCYAYSTDGKAQDRIGKTRTLYQREQHTAKRNQKHYRTENQRLHHRFAVFIYDIFFSSFPCHFILPHLNIL